MLKMLVVEDHALVREGLLATLKDLGEETQTFGVADANEAIGVLEAEDIDLMILDLMLPGTRGQTFLPVVRRRFPTVPVVVLSALDDVDTVTRVMKAGASGFVSKSGSSTDLLQALRAVLAGEIYLPPKLRELTNRSETAHGEGKTLAQRFGLTAAQVRVLDLLSEGRGNRQIAELLGLTEGTVKIHVSAIMKAMGVNNRSEAALLASRRRRKS
ncbi:MAG: response regulator transcription factor [Burkholderiaceae bacterium]|nr:response regulator transcription factor [Sulfuritalea sp.]MCF8173711.1 response regulator transcription factor [Burkholderiaceae bacterium]MCF8184658.1 response regulator transcription factor [Polynucleobacter sp.]